MIQSAGGNVKAFIMEARYQPSNVPPPRKRPLPVSIVNLADAQAVLPTSAELCDLVRAVAERQDRTAFAVLFKHFAPRVKTYLMRAGADPDAAEDLAQETMVALWRKAALFDARQAGVSTWVFTIARNLRVDRYRRQGGAVEVLSAEQADLDSMPEDAPALDERLHARRCEHRLREALRRLPPDQVRVLHLSYFEDQPHARIADELGIPLGTVKSRVRLAVAHLRKLLDGLA
ncbi:RNA polymerase sigma-70 factor (ECF subfamily) [Pseudacidovorax sp. 1753]|uniref:sigma-70 family RNA polymerase sigma factor n=1 Tax=Pseudacidovorax sp. 1753 TaxID=3156419 RepID=UPI0033978B26